MDSNHPSQPQLVEAGHEALVRGACEEARTAFERALNTGDRDAAKRSFRAAHDPGECKDLVWPGRGAVVAG